MFLDRSRTREVLLNKSECRHVNSTRSCNTSTITGITSTTITSQRLSLTIYTLFLIDQKFINSFNTTPGASHISPVRKSRLSKIKKLEPCLNSLISELILKTWTLDVPASDLSTLSNDFSM